MARGPFAVRVLIVLGALSAFGPLSMDLYLPALPALADDLGTTAALAQLTMSACMIGLAAGQLVVGPISDRFGRRKPLLIGMALYAVASVVCALAPALGVLVVARVVQGLAGGAGIVIARAVVRDVSEGEESAKIFAVLMLVTGVAPVAAPVIGGQVLRVGSWRAAFVVLTVVGALLLVASAWILRETLPAQRRVKGGVRAIGVELGIAVRDRELLAFSAVCALGSASLFCYIAMSPFVLQDRYGLSAQEFSLVFAANSVGLIIAARVGHHLVRTRGVESTLTIGLIACAGAASVLAVLTMAGAGLWVVLSVLFLAVSPVALVMPTATSLALAGQGDRAGTASGLIGMAQFALGGAVAPAISASGATPATMGIAMSCASIAALLVRYLAPRPGEVMPGHSDVVSEMVTTGVVPDLDPAPALVAIETPAEQVVTQDHPGPKE